MLHLFLKWSCLYSLSQEETMQSLICKVLSNTFKGITISEAVSVLDTLWKSKIPLLDFSRCSKAAVNNLSESWKTFLFQKCFRSDVIECCCKLLVITIYHK